MQHIALLVTFVTFLALTCDASFSSTGKVPGSKYGKQRNGMRVYIENDSQALSTTKVYVPESDNFEVNTKMKQSNLDPIWMTKTNAQSQPSDDPNSQHENMDVQFPNDALGSGDWESLAKSVFCNTAGDARTRVSAARDAVESSYPDMSCAFFATEAKYGWAYSTFWDHFAEKDYCGGYDFLGFDTENYQCGCDVGYSASSLQRGAMYDAPYEDYIYARDLMKSRESSYGLTHALILTYTEGHWADYLVQKCANDENDVNGQDSLFVGGCTN